MSVGMPESLWLEDFGALVHDAFGHHPYHVGSSLFEKKTGWRDVDVRLMLPDDEYAAMFGALDPTHEHMSAKWRSLVLAFATLGREMTGLPIDFQIQQQSYANARWGKPEHQRSALGVQVEFARHPEWRANKSPDAPE